MRDFIIEWTWEWKENGMGFLIFLFDWFLSGMNMPKSRHAFEWCSETQNRMFYIDDT